MLIAVGDRYDRLTSWGAVTTSTDGYFWNNVIDNPFNTRTSINSIAASSSRYVITGNGGLVASSTDLVSWEIDKIWFGNFQPLSVNYAENAFGNFGVFMAAGQGKFLEPQGPFRALSESAQIFRNVSGENWGWELIYSFADSFDSRFYNIKRITSPIDVWIAVGSADKKPFAVYSTNLGTNWTKISFPTIHGVEYAYDVVYNNGRYYFSCNNMVLSTADLSLPIWDASPQITTIYAKADLKQIAVNPINKHMVAASSGGLIYTTDLNSWYQFTAPGYRFKSICFYQDHWVAGAESYLTTYTYWTSKDTITWTPANNQVQIYDFAQI